jgi:hypothetical protein
MRDVELYRAILGLAWPWTVASVDLDVQAQRVVVHVEVEPGPLPCPECDVAAPRYDSKLCDFSESFPQPVGAFSETSPRLFS